MPPEGGGKLEMTNGEIPSLEDDELISEEAQRNENNNKNNNIYYKDDEDNEDIIITISSNSNNNSPNTRSPSSSDLYTTEIVRSLFGNDVGLVVGDFSCSHKRHSGRLYTAIDTICFYSNLFGYEHRVSVRLIHVVDVGTCKHGGICIRTEEGEEFKFRSLGDHRDDVLRLLTNLHARVHGIGKQQQQQQQQPQKQQQQLQQQQQQDLQQQQQQQKQQKQQKQQRGQPPVPSMPPSSSMPSSVRSRSPSPNHFFTTQPPKPTTTIKHRVRRGLERLSSTASLSSSPTNNATVPSDIDAATSNNTNNTSTNSNSSLPSIVKKPLARLKQVGKTVRENSPLSRSKSASDEENDSKTTSDVTTTANNNNTNKDIPPLDDDDSAAWDDLMASFYSKSFPNVALQDSCLSCDIDTFYNKFLADDAPHSLSTFQQNQIGDSEIQTSPWKPMEDQQQQQNDINPKTFLRTITFRHPITGSIGPSSSICTKLQRLQRFGNYAISLQTSTSLGRDVPVADCFTVEDQWILQSNSSKNDDSDMSSSTTLNVRFDVRFTKGTILRRIVESRSKSETKRWYLTYSSMLQSSLGQNSNDDDDDDDDENRKDKSEKDIKTASKVLHNNNKNHSSSSTSNHQGSLHRLLRQLIQSITTITTTISTTNVVILVCASVLLLLLFLLTLEIYVLRDKIHGLEGHIQELHQHQERSMEQMQEMLLSILQQQQRRQQR